MAYYAQLVDNTVTEVIEINDDIPNGAQFAHDLLGGEWVETLIDDPEKIYAGIGYTYDATTQNFIPPPQPPAPPRPEQE